MPRPAFNPEEFESEHIEALVAAGMSEDEIAVYCQCSRPTLRRYFSQELKHGRIRRRARLLIELYDAGLHGKIAAAKAFLKLTEPPTSEPEPAPTT